MEDSGRNAPVRPHHLLWPGGTGLGGAGGGKLDTQLEGKASHQDSGFTDSFLLCVCLIVLQLMAFLYSL